MPFKTQMRQARWNSEEQLKNKLLARLTLKRSDLSQGLANNRPLEHEEHHDYEVFQDKHTRDSIWYMHHPQYQFLNILEVINEAWGRGGNQPRNTVGAFLFCWHKYFLSRIEWMIYQEGVQQVLNFNLLWFSYKLSNLFIIVTIQG